MQRDPALTLPGMLDSLAAQYGDRPALVGPAASLTYAGLAARSQQVAHWAATQVPGATVGLLMQNSPDYVALWLGLTRAGCVVALLNHNLPTDQLRHAVQTANCRMIIAQSGLGAGLTEVPVLPVETIEQSARATSLPTPKPADTALLVYTSGTTGLPKAARVSHGRVLEWALWFAGMMNVQPDDRIYDCLPLYHSTGGIVAIGASLVRGASVFIAPGFHASRFWAEVADNDCTIFFYIGELCRYLLAQPAPAARHRLRLACGNGLQAHVWEAFQDRFAIPQILEFYAATEGSVSLYNCEGKPGAIGRVPPFLQARFPLTLIRINAETGAPLRGADGLCQLCAAGEVGEALGQITGSEDLPARHFDGYTDPGATSHKLIENVKAPGDRWFRSGDLMRRDAAGFFYFVDRMGDTFRWKGENVSTLEIAAAIRAAPGVNDAVVYGVQVPGHEGRAGMAAIVPGANFDPGALWIHVNAALPAYAQPVFIRLCRTLELTGTFKFPAARLAAESFIGLDDPVLLINRAARSYRPSSPDVITDIQNGTYRL